jgi:hypothetical protein
MSAGARAGRARVGCQHTDVLSADPVDAEKRRGLPRSGSAVLGRVLFGYFLLHEQEKGTRSPQASGSSDIDLAPQCNRKMDDQLRCWKPGVRPNDELWKVPSSPQASGSFAFYLSAQRRNRIKMDSGVRRNDERGELRRWKPCVRRNDRPGQMMNSRIRIMDKSE